MQIAHRPARTIACALGLLTLAAAPAAALTTTGNAGPPGGRLLTASVATAADAARGAMPHARRAPHGKLEQRTLRHHRKTSRRARLSASGRAIAPAGAPRRVREIIAAGNRIAHKPYVWGGGHGSWRAAGYDCSGSVGYALHGADLLDTPTTSGALTTYGRSGKGRWVTVYANGGHVYMVVAGLRFDTSARDDSGSRWTRDTRDAGGYAERHPAGL